jgi:CTP synthase
VLHWEDANSTEANPNCTHKVVIDMPEISQTHLGGTMRLGKRRTIFVNKECLARKLRAPHSPSSLALCSVAQDCGVCVCGPFAGKLYDDADSVEERHRHRFEVNPDVVDAIEACGLQFVGHDADGRQGPEEKLLGQY